MSQETELQREHLCKQKPQLMLRRQWGKGQPRVALGQGLGDEGDLELFYHEQEQITLNFFQFSHL